MRHQWLSIDCASPSRVSHVVRSDGGTRSGLRYSRRMRTAPLRCARRVAAAMLGLSVACDASPPTAVMTSAASGLSSTAGSVAYPAPIGSTSNPSTSPPLTEFVEWFAKNRKNISGATVNPVCDQPRAGWCRGACGASLPSTDRCTIVFASADPSNAAVILDRDVFADCGIAGASRETGSYGRRRSTCLDPSPAFDGFSVVLFHMSSPLRRSVGAELVIASPGYVDDDSVYR